MCRGSQSDCKVHLFVDQVDWFDLALMWPKGKERKRRSDREGASTTGASLQAITERSTHTTGHSNAPTGDRRIVHPLELNYWTSLELQGPMYIP